MTPPRRRLLIAAIAVALVALALGALFQFSTQEALERAEALRRQVRELVVESENGPMSLSASFGVACFPVHGDSPSALLRSADQALYTAKQSGRDRVVLRRRGPRVPC